MLPVEYSADDFLSLTLLNFNPENLKRWWYRFKTVWHSQYPKYEKNIVITLDIPRRPPSYLGAYIVTNCSAGSRPRGEGMGGGGGRSPKQFFCLKIRGGGPSGPSSRSATELSIVLYCNFKVSAESFLRTALRWYVTP